MDLQYPGNEGELVQFPSSDIDRDQTSSPPPSPNAFSQEPDFQLSDWPGGPSDFDLGGNAEPIPAASESDLWDEQSVPADSDPTEFHPLINGM
jgi:hypothetical protein